MSRRALRKPDPGLDLSRHSIQWENLPRPWRTEATFGRVASLELEVGSGKGLFLAAAGSTTPDHDFLGIERAAKYARHTAARLAGRQLVNAKVLHGDAERLFAELLPDSAACAVHVYFPDPWWKARHKKRRLLNERFLRDVQRVLTAEGALHFWTDVQEYFETTLELLVGASSLIGPLPVPEQPAEHDLDYRTHFERRTRLNGEPVYRAAFRKLPTLA